jgi:hypothetical protein
VEQLSNVIPRDAPVLTFAPLGSLILDSSSNSFKRVGKAERIRPQIVVDVSFNQDMPMRTL